MVAHRLERLCPLTSTSGVRDVETRQGPAHPLWALLVLIALSGLLLDGLTGPAAALAYAASYEGGSPSDAADLDSDPIDAGPRPTAVVTLISADRPVNLRERARPAPCRRQVPPPRSSPA